MICLIITFLIISPFLIVQNKDPESPYLTFASSLSLSYGILGFLGLIFVFLRLTYIPLYLLILSTFFVLIFSNNYRNKLIYLWDISIKEIKLINKLKTYEKTLKFFYFILFLFFIVSIGPINHSDTANIYVGYPYKFWIKNSHFIDGNLNQGLLGIGDFANIFYFQEGTTWLIRTSQFLPLLILFFYLLKRRISNFYFLIFITSPVFIQWLTIGKNNFLTESCLALSFLVWEKNRDVKYLPHIFSIVFISISFKISAILVSIPIIFYIIFYYRNSLIFLEFKNCFNYISIPLVFSFTLLLTIFFYRYFLIDNPFYPLFSEFFNPENQQLIDWEQTLRVWERKGLFPLWIFIPKTIGKISFVLGPANLLLIIFSLTYFLKNLNSNNGRLKVGIYQFIFLLIFSQGRADYYISPLILISLGVPSLKIKDFKSSNKMFKLISIVKNILKITIFAQFVMFFVSLLYSITIVLYVLYDYEAGMNKTAYNFYNSQEIQKFAEPPVYSEITGMTHLYSKIPFIANQKFDGCFYYDKSINSKQKYKVCMEREGVRTIILEKDKLKNNQDFSCDTRNLIRASRNIFLEENLSVDFCKLK
tara:strand:- start:3259 stop:5028 length:1770 start_codon:yes stop_codon:yes gene_type:complete